MQGSGSSKNAASGGKKQKIVVSNFVPGNARDSTERIVGKIVKSNMNVASNPSPLHTQGSVGSTSIKSSSQTKPVRSNNAASSNVKGINTTVANVVTAGK